MALYFSEDYIQELIDKNDIVEYISRSVHLKRAGSTYKGLCPFHKEKTPSFSVSPDKQLFYCFGCGKGGTVINFAMHQENLDFVEAVKLLAEKCGMELPDDNRNTNDNNLKTRQKIYKINSLAGRFFYDRLFEECGTAAREYITKRQLVQATVNRFGLGYAPDGNALLKYLRSQGFTDEEIVESGVVGKSENGDIYDRFRNRLMFPIIDIRKNIIGFGGRVMDDSKPKYLNSPETPAFNKSYNLFGLNMAKNSKEDYFILVEGYMDVIQLHQNGIDSAVATLGTALTPEQARIIKRHKTRVITAYDSDEPGQAATKRAIELLNEEGLKVFVLAIPGSKDPDEYIKANGAGAFRDLIDSALEQTEYKIKKLREVYDLDIITQKSDYVNAVARELIKIKSPVEQELYVKQISAETGVSAESIFAEMARLRKANEKNEEISNFRKQSVITTKKPNDLQKARCINAQKLVLNIMCYHKAQANYITNHLSESHFDKGLNQIFSILKNTRQSGGEPDPRIIVSNFPDVPLAAEVLHDDKNIDNIEKATTQAVEIILNYNKKNLLQNTLKNEGLSTLDKLNQINEVLSNKGKGGENDSE